MTHIPMHFAGTTVESLLEQNGELDRRSVAELMYKNNYFEEKVDLSGATIYLERRTREGSVLRRTVFENGFMNFYYSLNPNHDLKTQTRY